MLGNLFLTSQGGVKWNPEEGIKWFKKAAELGDAQAAFQLGVVYISGVVPRDEDEMRKWMKVAAVRGWTEAEYLTWKPMSSKDARRRLKEHEETDC